MLITQQQELNKNQQQRKDILKAALWKRSQLTYLLKVNQLKFVKKTGRLIHTGTQNLRGFTIVQKKMPCFVSVACLPKKRAPYRVP